MGKSSKNIIDPGGCLAALFFLVLLLGCLFGTTKKLFGSAGEPVGYAVLVLLAFAFFRHVWRSAKK